MIFGHNCPNKYNLGMKNETPKFNLQLRREANLRLLLWYMEERQTIYVKRQAGEPFPWTADPILKGRRLENVYREQDRETTWLRENWLEPYADHDNLWFAVCM